MASRVAKNPVVIPKGVEVNVQGNVVHIKGQKGSLSIECHELVRLEKIDDHTFQVAMSDDSASANVQAGTLRAIVSNMVTGVNSGFEKKLLLVGVGYRAQVKGKSLDLTLGFSHPVNFPIPEGITIETPSQTEIIIKGINKQLVGQVAANIRAYRPPEPYKGKGVRYSTEKVILKETKKK